MKTIQEWLSELPEPYRRVALRYHSNYSKMGKADCLANALVLGFKWSSSKEGSTYWKEVHEMCMLGEFDREPITNRRYYKPKEKKDIKAKFVNDKKVVAPAKVKPVVKRIRAKKEVKPVTAAMLYPNIDTALEGIYKPFSERKKQIDKQTKN